MAVSGVQAILPKARGMFAKRISVSEYEEMMRRRTVPELSLLLRQHPYFRGNLASLSPSDPHRGQIEELLDMDIFEKYQTLLKFDFEDEGFTTYYLIQCEMREILKALRMLSIGQPGVYVQHIPAYLIGHLRFDLYELAQANDFFGVVEAMRMTPYYKTLRSVLEADPDLRDFPTVEARLLRAYYEMVFEQIDKSFSGREAADVKDLLILEASTYNIQLIIRVKTYYSHAYTNDQIRALLLPYNYRIPKRTLEEMIDAPNVERVIAIMKNSTFAKHVTGDDPDQIATSGDRLIYRHARRILHLNPSPYAALAAFVVLAKLERDNVINVVEGVRYKLSPEGIRSMLRY